MEAVLLNQKPIRFLARFMRTELMNPSSNLVVVTGAREAHSTQQWLLHHHLANMHEATSEAIRCTPPSSPTKPWTATESVYALSRYGIGLMHTTTATICDKTAVTATLGFSHHMVWSETQTMLQTAQNNVTVAGETRTRTAVLFYHRSLITDVFPHWYNHIRYKCLKLRDSNVTMLTILGYDDDVVM